MRTRVKNRTAIVALIATVLGACSSSSSSSSHGRSSTSAVSRGMSAATTAARPPSATPLAAQAYVWGSPLVITERTLQTFAGLFGVNRVFSQSALSNASSRTVVAPNVDTLYSVAVVDLRGGPVVLHMPRIADKYWVYQFIDAWTDSFAYIGTRATGGRAGTWLVAPSGWRGATPSGMARITSPTPQLFLLGRWFVASAADLPLIAAALHTVTLRPLVADQTTPAIGPASGTPQTAAAAGAQFFDELGDALAVNAPATAADRRALASFASLGIGPGRHPAARGTIAARGALAAGVAAGAARIRAAARDNGAAANGWASRAIVGTYTDSLVRALVAQVGWGANVPAEAVYARAVVDPNGRPFDGRHTYRMHFAASASPPVRAFWSLTLYGPDQFLVDNPLHRFAISTRSPGFRRAADGSFDIWIGNRPPASGTSNWLPAPPGPFLLALRMYLPDAQVIAGRYVLPGVQRVG